ncbi:hypothetical protein IAT38_002832 [Cryptococcus sp. DSM 104549]
MPKATKKKKEKQADFSKAKLKLGKGKKVASNATDTSFKARSIALPGQEALSRALNLEEGAVLSEPTTANGLSLDEVLVRFRHPNAGVRKESIGGVKEILGQGVGRETGKVLRALGGLITDDDATVRKTLVGILEWYMSQLPISALSPHLPLLLLQTSSALSHIFPEIRLDACKLVHLFLRLVPSHVVGSWPYQPSNILEGLRLAVGLGGEKGVNSQIGRLTGGAKLVTMRAMREFVKCGIDEKGEGEAWKEGWVEGSQRGQGVQGRRRVVKDDVDLQLEGWVVGGKAWSAVEDGGSWEVGRLGADSGKGDEGGVVGVISQLYIQLHPLLQSTFLEAAPTAFSPSSTTSPSGEDIPLALCTTTASLTELLGRAILSRASSLPNAELKQVRACVSDFLKRMAAWFPFHSPRSQLPTPGGLTPGFELSLAYANLAVMLAPRPCALEFPQSLERGKKEVGWRERVKATEEAWRKMREMERVSKGKGKAGAADHWAMEEVAEWVDDVLSPNKDALAPALTPEAYTAILPIIWALIVQPPPSQSDQVDIPSSVGAAFLKHLSRQAATSNLREIGDEFLIAVISVHERRYPTLSFYVAQGSPLRAGVREWFDGLPRTLWEMGTKKEGASERLLRFLLDVGLKGQGSLEQPYSILDGKSFTTIAPQLAPLYHIQHHSRGSIPGPWTKLQTPSVKRLGLDVAKVWGEWDQEERLSDAVGRACSLAKESEWGVYWSR